MKTFISKGSFKNGMFTQPFTKEIDAVSKKLAIEKTYAEFGSKHRCNRRQIKIDEVKEKKDEQRKKETITKKES